MNLDTSTGPSPGLEALQRFLLDGKTRASWLARLEAVAGSGAGEKGSRSPGRDLLRRQVDWITAFLSRVIDQARARGGAGGGTRSDEQAVSGDSPGEPPAPAGVGSKPPTGASFPGLASFSPTAPVKSLGSTPASSPAPSPAPFPSTCSQVSPHPGVNPDSLPGSLKEIASLLATLKLHRRALVEQVRAGSAGMDEPGAMAMEPALLEGKLVFLERAFDELELAALFSLAGEAGETPVNLETGKMERTSGRENGENVLGVSNGKDPGGTKNGDGREDGTGSGRVPGDLTSGYLARLCMEFRTPLAALQLSLENLEKHGARLTPSQWRMTLETMSRSYKALRAYLENLALARRLEMGNLDLNAGEGRVDIGVIAGEVAGYLEPVASATGVKLEGWASPGLLVQGDKYVIEQVVRMLLDVALKFSERGSRVEFNLTRVKNRRENGIHDGVLLSISASTTATAWGAISVGGTRARDKAGLAAAGNSFRMEGDPPGRAAAGDPGGEARLEITLARRVVELLGGYIESRIAGGASPALHLEMFLPSLAEEDLGEVDGRA